MVHVFEDPVVPCSEFAPKKLLPTLAFKVQESWARRSPEVPSNSYDSTILFNYFSEVLQVPEL